MEAVIFLILGAILGVFLDRVATETGFDEVIKSFIRSIIRIGGNSKKIQTGISPYLTVGKLTIEDWEILDGLFPGGIKFITKVEPTDVQLPEDLKAIRREIEKEIEKKKQKNIPTPYNGKHYALVDCNFHRHDDSMETNTCYLSFKYSEYFNFLATSESLDKNIPNENITVREKYYKYAKPTDIKHEFLYNSLGVNLAVITKDQKLVIVKRGKSVDVLPGIFSSSMNEGISRDLDQETNRGIDIHHLAYRGLKEELGIDKGDIRELCLSSMGFSRKWCQHGILGHALLNIKFDELKKLLPVSKDACFEIESNPVRSNESLFMIFGVPFRPQAFAEFLKQGIPFTSWGLCCFILSFLATDFTHSDLDHAFSDDCWKDTSFIK